MIWQTLKNNLNNLRSQPLHNTGWNTVHAKFAYAGVALFFAVACLLVWVPTAAASTRTRFKQIIAPLHCLFDEVNDGSGAVVYVTPETCGTVVQPGSTKQPTASRSITSNSEPVPVEYYSGMLYLDTEGGSVNSKNGYMLIVRPGLVYSFRLPGDSPVGAPRTIEITSIRGGVVTITFGPGDRQAVLHEGQHISADIAFGTAVDVEITVVQVNDDATAVLHVTFPAQTQMADATVEDNHTDVALIVLGLLVAASLYVHAHSRYRSRRMVYYDKNWKIDETIK